MWWPDGWPRCISRPRLAPAQNLMNEGISADRIFVTGNSGIDAVMFVRDGLESGKLESRGLPALVVAEN